MTNNQNSMTTDPCRAIISALKAAKRVLVVSHTNPDGDAVGSSLAMAHYLESIGKEVIILFDSPVPAVYEYLSGTDRMFRAETYDQAITVDAVVSLECPTPDRMGEVNNRLSGNETIICIDHHLDSEAYGAVNWIDTSFSSVGEMLWYLFKSDDYQLDETVAEQLYTAVMTDTGRFRFDNTSPRSMICASELIAAGAKPDKISQAVYYNTKPSTLKLLGLVLHGIQFIADNRICYLSLTNEMLASAGAERSEAEGLIDFTLYGSSVQLGAMFKEADPSRTRVSLRSAVNINVAEIAGEFGGGGHFRAAGFDVEAGMEQARQIVLKRLKEAVHDIQVTI